MKLFFKPPLSLPARRIWAALLTGIPFSVYKIGVGWHAFGRGLDTAGILLIAWGLIDATANLLSIPFPGKVRYCILSNIGHWIDRRASPARWENILIGVDTLIALAMVSGMIWFDCLPLDPAAMKIIWNVAVVCNLLAVGIQQVWLAVFNGKPVPDPAR